MSLFIRVAAKSFRLTPEYKCQIVTVATFIEVNEKNSRCLIFRKKEILEETHILNKKQERITVIDALRGFALLGVILIHMVQHYGIFSGPREDAFPQIDALISWIASNVIMGRFINIFAFLFGLSFFIQMDRAQHKGLDFRGRFLWRMFILFLIGMIGNLFYTGDILSIYACFGVLVISL